MMNFAAAFLWTLLALVTGLAAISAVHRHREQLNTSIMDEDNAPQENRTSAAAYVFRISSVTLKEWILILFAAVLVGATAFRLQIAQVHAVTGSKLLVTALFLSAAMVVDWFTHRIPNRLVLVMLAAGTLFLGLEFLFQREIFRSQLLAALVGLIGFLVFFYLMARLTGGGIGMGDVKLIAAEGWLAGFTTTLTAVLFSMIVCSLAAVVLLITKKKAKQDQVPFGPFLFFGYIITLLICNL